MRSDKDKCGGMVHIPASWKPGTSLSSVTPLEFQNPKDATEWPLYVAGDQQGQCLARMTDGSVRNTFCEIAKRSTGMTADADAFPAGTGYRVLIAPGETVQMRNDMATSWGCGLAARGWLRLAGVWSRYLAPPYRIGAAFDDVYELGRLNNALKFGPLHPFDVGQIFTMGRGKTAHMAMLIGMHENRVFTIDGGQEDKNGNQCILWRERTPIMTSDGRIAELVDDKRREVRWQLDMTAEGLRKKMLLDWRLPYRFGSASIPHPLTNKNG